MSHHESWHMLSAYLDNELSPNEWALVESHLQNCRLCKRELETLHKTKMLMGSVPRRAFPADLLAQVQRNLRPSSVWGIFLDRCARPRVWIPTGAFAVVILLLALWVGGKNMLTDRYLPLEPFLAAHSRYAAEGLIPEGDPVASDFSAHLAAYHGQK